LSHDETTTPSAEQIAEQAQEHLSQILSVSGLDCQAVLSSVESDVVHLQIVGPDAGLLIGRRGQTLDSLQYLLLVMVSHNRALSQRFRVMLDADGYRKRREEALQALAESLAARVKQTGQEAVLEPLNALERRIVHTALVNDTEVETYSEGEEPNRHVVITPRKS
jgi:spoIIIJ-associated protein